MVAMNAGVEKIAQRPGLGVGEVWQLRDGGAGTGAGTFFGR
ncbi:hypothetical protein [Streptomyces rhizosphaericus]|nr:hypothetical protein [Streptomyces rhizosphaericus]